MENPWKPQGYPCDLDQHGSQVSDSLLQQSIAETSAPKQRREHKELGNLVPDTLQ